MAIQQMLIGVAPYIVEAKLWGAAGGVSQNCSGNPTGTGGGGGWYGGGGGSGDCGACANGSAGGGSGYLNSTYFNESIHFATTAGINTPGTDDEDHADSAGVPNASSHGNHGRLVLRVNGVLVGSWSYSGSVQSYTLA